MGQCNGLYGTHKQTKYFAQHRNNLSEDDGVGPYLSGAEYSDVLIAKAVQKNGELDLVVYPTDEAGFKSMQIDGLVPGASYRLKSEGLEAFSADNSSRRTINVPVRGRTEFRISRVS